VEARLILFTNGQHRQSALQTGQVDGAMTDLVALVTQTASDFKLTGTLSTDGNFPLLSQEPIASKERVSVGTMEISVTNYLVDQYLQDTKVVEKVYVNEIPARLEAVASGQLDAGIFPEPFASIGALRGLERTFFEGIPEESLNIIAFTEQAIKGKQEAIRAFHKAYARAVGDIREDGELAKDALMNHIPNLPPDVRSAIRLPFYHEPRLPSDDFVRGIIAWTSSVTGKTYEAAPSDMLDARFIGGT
jgi:NitT/TauT family transport system substrate-binding protein